MNTSYFAKYRRVTGVNIAIKPAPGFAGPSYPDLFPKWSFLKKYKEDGNEADYTREYHAQVLSKLDPNKVYDDLKDSTLLCWEKSGEFCHRRLVAEWIEKALGITVPEV